LKNNKYKFKTIGVVAPMNMRDITSAFRLKHWASVLEERKSSGLSVRAYCESAGIHENSFYYWQKKLRESVCKELSAIDDNAASLESVRFMEIPLPTQSILPAANYPQSRVCIETSGVRITADNDYPADKLAILVREVARPC
jgi:hypothetical protein